MANILVLFPFLPTRIPNDHHFANWNPERRVNKNQSQSSPKLWEKSPRLWEKSPTAWDFGGTMLLQLFFLKMLLQLLFFKMLLQLFFKMLL